MNMVAIIIIAILFPLLTGFLLQGKHYFLLKNRQYGRKVGFKKILKRDFTTMFKCLWMLILPIPYTLSAVFVWYFVFYTQNIYFDPTFEGIAITALIPGFFILYSLIVAILLSVLWTEYKTMRMAVKKYDLETFMDLRDEEMSPLVHTLVFVLSACVLGGFMILNYTDVTSGIICIASTSYLFALVFFVLVEIDDPCSGIWVVGSIPKVWLHIDAKAWRDRRNSDAHRMFIEKLKEVAENEEIFGASIEEDRRIDISEDLTDI